MKPTFTIGSTEISVRYAVFSIVIALVALFVALPSFPNVAENSQAISLTAGLVAADDGSGDGVGDPGGTGSDGGGDGGTGDAIGGGGSGGSIGGIGDGGDTGTGGGGSGGDTGTGDGVGDPGDGCCGDGDTGTGDTGIGDTGTGDGIGDPGDGCCGDGDTGTGEGIGDTGEGDGVGDPGDGCCDGGEPVGETPGGETPGGETPGGGEPAPQLVCSLAASDHTITRGQTALLFWTTSGATTASFFNFGPVGVNGSLVVSPNISTTYTLVATGPGGTVTCVTTITVTDEPAPVPPLTCDAFTASPGTLSQAGETTLTWSTSNASSVSINNGIGPVSVDGSRVVNVNSTTVFILTASEGVRAVTCSVTVTIVPNAVLPSCDAFTASPTRVRSGQNTTLTWNTTNATAVSINQGVGSVSGDGTQSVRIDGNTTFVLTASNVSGSTTCQTTVTIESDGGGGGGGGGGSNAPRCTLKASDTRVQSGERVTLSWKNTRTEDVLLRDNRGNTIANSKRDRDIDEDEDSVTVRPTRTTTYTLTASRGSRERECKVEVKVNDISISSVRGISLSNVPYTGFDAGPFLTSVFYGLLMLWALAVAYILVIRREAVFGVKLSETPTPHSAITPSFTETVSAPTADAPQNIPMGTMATATAPRGYEAYYENVEPTTEEVVPAPTVGEAQDEGDIDMLEARAHDAHVLMSTDALHFIMGTTREEKERIELLDMVVGAAKANFPKEDGWVVVNKDRILSLLK